MLNLFEFEPVRDHLTSEAWIYSDRDINGLFFVYFWSFQTIITIFTTNKCEQNVHPVYGAGIQTHDLRNTFLLP